MKNSKVNGNPISQNGRFVNPFSEKSFEGVIAQNLSDVKSFLKYFSETPEAQTVENVKTFFKIFFYGAELRSKVAKLKAELDALEYRTFVYPRTIKGASTAEFIKTKREYNKYRAEIEAMGRIADEIETASPHRPRLDFAPQTNGNAPQHHPPLRSVKLTVEKKKPSETLAGRFRELAVSIQFHLGICLLWYAPQFRL